MSPIPFVLGRVTDPMMARLAIENRLNRHFYRLQEKRAAHTGADVTIAGDDDVEHAHRKSIPWADRQRITRLAERLGRLGHDDQRLSAPARPSPQPMPADPHPSPDG